MSAQMRSPWRFVQLLRVIVLAALFALPASVLAAPDVPSRTCVASLSEAAQLTAQRRSQEFDRLPRYHLELELARGLGRFSLRETAEITNHTGQALPGLTFVVYANLMGSKAAPPVRLLSGRCDAAHACRVIERSRGVIEVHLEQPLGPDARVEVSFELEGELPVMSEQRISYEGQLSEAIAGLGKQAPSEDYGLLALADGTASMGGFYAVLATRRNDGWVTPTPSGLGDLTSDDLAHFSASVTVPREVRLATTGVRVEEQTGASPTRTVSFCAALVRDFAVLASASFASVEAVVHGTRVRVHVSPHARALAQRVLDAASQALALFSDAFHPYPYRELDVVEAPLVGGVGGVEFSGLVTVARMMMSDQQSSPLASLLANVSGAQLSSHEEMLDMVIAHEVAHQWWHVLVGSDSRGQPFVDEGLAQWSALFFLERQRSSLAAQRAEHQLELSYRVMRMMGEADRAVNQPVEAFSSTLAYGGIVYGKGPLVYRELRRVVGERAFFQAVSTYAARHAFGSAPHGALFDLLASSARANEVRRLTSRWLEEAHGDDDIKAALPMGLPGLPGLSLDGRKRTGAQGPASAPDLGDLLKQLQQALGSK